MDRSEFKKLTYREKLNFLKQEGYDVKKEYPSPQALTDKQIMEMKPTVDFQAHTMFHPYLSSCSDSEAEYEIRESKEVLQKKYGLDVNAFSYPIGDYSEREINFVKEAGFECALTVDCGFNDIETDPFRLRRLSVNDTDDKYELLVKASGVWAYVRNIFSKN